MTMFPSNSIHCSVLMISMVCIIISIILNPIGVECQKPLGDLCDGDLQCSSGFCRKPQGINIGKVCVCSPGQYLMANCNRCENCPSGSIPSTDFRNCPNLPAGVGSTSCIPCPAGTRATSNGIQQSTCKDCSINSYSRAGFDFCLHCPVGQFTPQAGSPQCSICPTNSVADAFNSNPGTCCPRFASLYNNGTIYGQAENPQFPDQALAGGAPSEPYVPNTYPSILYSNSRFIMWNTPADPFQGFAFYYQNQLKTFTQNFLRAYIVSPRFKYFVVFNPDGNICKYKGAGPACNRGLIWCSFGSNPPGRDRYIHNMQPDGNLCTYKVDGAGNILSRVWCATNDPANNVPGSYLEINDQGEFCRKQPDGSIVIPCLSA